MCGLFVLLDIAYAPIEASYAVHTSLVCGFVRGMWGCAIEPNLPLALAMGRPLGPMLTEMPSSVSREQPCAWPSRSSGGISPAARGLPQRYHWGMKSYVLFRMPDRTLVQAAPGDLIGRLRMSELCIPDERISEAHAMVSLRSGDLRLLGLRGAIALNGVRVEDPILEAGQVLELAAGLALEVVEVRLPSQVLALRGQGLSSVALSGVCSLYGNPPRLVRGHRVDAAGWFFNDGHTWFFTPRGTHEPRGPVTAGDEINVEGWRGELVWRTIAAGVDATRGVMSQPALRIEDYYDTVRIFVGAELKVQLHGLRAKLFSEVMEVGQPISWEAVAASLWNDSADRWTLRRRWDAVLARLRSSLADGGVRSDLLCSDGMGCIAVVIYPHDSLVKAD